MARIRFISIILFLLPSLLMISLFVIYPLFQTIYFSFTNARLSTLSTIQWAGLENYFFLFKDHFWWISLKNTFIFTFFSVVIETLLGIIFALLILEKFPGIGLMRASILIPWAIPSVVSAKIWAWMFNDLFGVINEALIQLNMIEKPVAWLAESGLSLPIIIFVDVWKMTPFMTLLILAGLQDIPKSVMEAATLDGATKLKRVLFIQVPMIRPAILIAVLFRSLDALRVFDLPYVLLGNSKSSSVLSIFIRQQLVDFQEIGYGSAAAFITFSIFGVFSVVYIAISSRSLGIMKT